MHTCRTVFNRLVVNSGELSDADGFVALAHYAQMGFDIIFAFHVAGFMHSR